jgi:hypothetical protein
MGRFYSGDIEGKFWFGVQSSDDISNLVSCKYQEYLYWEGCGCTIENEDDVWKFCEEDCEEDCEDVYCHECFENKEEHIERWEEEGGYEEGERLYREGNELVYPIDEDYLDELKENLKKIEDKIDKDIISAYKKVENDERILNLFSGVYNEVDEIINNWDNENDKEKKEQYELIARYGLGLQIKYYLEQEDNIQCAVYCEL